MSRKYLLACGILSSLIYVTADIPGALSEGWTINETMHSVFTGITVVMFVTSMMYAAHAAGANFLAYSMFAMGGHHAVR